jgi:ABC-2 type transport system permease protein
MNSTVMAEPSSHASAVTTAVVSPLQQFYWSVRRELWENRSIYLAPAIVGAVFIVGYLVLVAVSPSRLRAPFAGGTTPHSAALTHYDMVAGAMMLTNMIIAIFYCFDALYSERRDRSVLFWKSLPVSDTITVLAKASVPIVLLPVIGWAVATIVQLVMAGLTSIVMAGSGVSVWNHLQLPRISLLLLYHLVTVHSLWWTPFFGWFLLVSAWARRTPILWGVLPILVVVVVEKIALNTTHFAGVLGNSMMTGSLDVMAPPNTFPTHPMTHMTPLRFITDPGLWVRFAVCALFLFGAVRLRRQRGPI